MSFSFGQPSILIFGHKIPLIVLKNFSLPLVICPQPRLLLNQRHENSKDIALHHYIVNDPYFQVFDIVSDILENRNAHHEQTEVYFLHLLLQLFNRSCLEDLINFFLFFLFRTELFLLPTLYPVLDCSSNLRGDLFIAVVNYLDKELLTLMDCGVMIQHDFKHIAHNGLMINCQVNLQGVELSHFILNHGQDISLPGRSDEKINN